MITREMMPTLAPVTVVVNDDRQRLLDMLETLLFKCDDEKSMTRAVNDAMSLVKELKQSEVVEHAPKDMLYIRQLVEGKVFMVPIKLAPIQGLREGLQKCAVHDPHNHFGQMRAVLCNPEVVEYAARVYLQLSEGS